MSQKLSVKVNGEWFTTSKLSKIKGSSRSYAREAINKYLDGEITEEQLFAPPPPRKLVITIDGVDYDCRQIQRTSGLKNHDYIRQLMRRYANGEHQLKEKLVPSKKPAFQPKAPVTKSVDGDRSPGWWERKHLNPTGFFKNEPVAGARLVDPRLHF